MDRRSSVVVRIPNMPAVRAALVANPLFRAGVFEPPGFAFVVDGNGNYVVNASGSYLFVPAAS